MSADSERPPRVSVGLAVFNGEAYLEQAITSILAQTLHRLRVGVVGQRID